MMDHEVGYAFRCGPFALERIFAFLHKDQAIPQRLAKAQSTRRGTSLAQMRSLARQVGLNMQMARRTGHGAIPLPALVQWKVGHFAALIEENDGRYHTQDPTFGTDFWVSRTALNDEASGYFLIPDGELPRGWEPVESATGRSVWGKGVVDVVEEPTPDEPEEPCCSDGECEPGMAAYSIKLLNVGLHLFDNPLGYSPPRGPDVRFEVDYNQGDVFQPQTFAYS